MFKNRGFLLMCLLNAVSWVSLTMLNTTIVPYAVSLGATAAIAGAVSGFYFLVSFGTRLMYGPLERRISKRTLFLAASVLLTITTLGFIAVRSVVLLLVLRAIQGAGYSLVSTLSMSLAADTLPEDQIGPGIGYFGLTTIIGQIAAPALGLELKERFGFFTMLAVALALRVIALLLAFTIPKSDVLPKKYAAPKQTWSIWNFVERKALLPAGVGFLFSILNSSLTSFMVLHAEANNISGASLFFTVSTLTMFLMRSLCSRYTDKRSLASTAVFSGVFCIATMLLVGLGESMTALLLGGASFGIGYGTLLPVTQARSVQLPPPERRSLGSSTYYLGIDLGFTMSNLVCGYVVETAGSNTMYLSLIIPALGAMALALWKGRTVPQTNK